MKNQKFHLTENGPTPCHIRFRRCPYEIEGTKSEVTAIWQKQLEEEFSEQTLASTSKTDLNRNLEAARAVIDNWVSYLPHPDSRAYYSREETEVAKKLAASALNGPYYASIVAKDRSWSTNGVSDVRRYSLNDGTVGYFKPFKANSLKESFFTAYGTNSLAACISEVNAYRMSQLMGEKFSKLVPKTEIRAVDEEIGSLQIEVDESDDADPNFNDYEGLREDYRKAAIFDFVIGNLDRHSENFLYGEQKDEFAGQGYRPAIRLIDNSMAFPENGKVKVNHSFFSQNEPLSNGYSGVSDNELKLKSDEIEALYKARDGVSKWITDGTILESNGKEALLRINAVLGANSICNITFYLRTFR